MQDKEGKNHIDSNFPNSQNLLQENLCIKGEQKVSILKIQ